MARKPQVTVGTEHQYFSSIDVNFGILFRLNRTEVRIDTCRFYLVRFIVFRGPFSQYIQVGQAINVSHYTFYYAITANKDMNFFN
jgi:hypothetical protein